MQLADTPSPQTATLGLHPFTTHGLARSSNNCLVLTTYCVGSIIALETVSEHVSMPSTRSSYNAEDCQVQVARLISDETPLNVDDRNQSVL